MHQRHTTMRLLATCLLACSLCLTAQAQLKTADLQPLQFMAGRWTTQHPWGDMEEYWSVPLGNCMMCTYRCVNKGKVVFYEFMAVEWQADTTRLMLRHFGPGNIGWEEKDQPITYYLTRMGAQEAQFEKPDGTIKLLYKRTSPTQLVAVLERKTDKGWKTDTFTYTLTP